jgi:hypothetical protein
MSSICFHVGVWIELRCVFYVNVPGEYVYISFAFLQMHDGVRVLHLQHRHVIGRFHMTCMSATLNAYSLHL